VGYAIGQPRANVTCVEATWTQPKVTCTTKAARFSIWLAIDGWTSTDMHVKAPEPRTVAVGTESDCLGGKLTTTAWHMANPEHTFQYFSDVHPAVGDVIWAQVRFAGGWFTIALRNKTTGEQATTLQVVPKIARVVARWEVSSVFTDCDIKCRPTPLAKFAPIVFTSVEATMNGKRVAVGGAAIIDVVEDATKSRVLRMVVSRIAPSGRSFTVTWKHA
jgi:hypothetical protein